MGEIKISLKFGISHKKQLLCELKKTVDKKND